MAQPKKGDTVQVHYTGKLDDGTVFDTSEEREPLQFTLGAEQVIPGFEEAVSDMDVGEKKSVTIPVNKAYGPRQDEMVFLVPQEQFPEDIEPQEGQQLQLQHPSGQTLVAVVTDVSQQGVTLDANHPLAGQDLTFDLELVGIA